MILEGTVHKFGRDVDTDVIIPARYLNTSDAAELGAHCMEDIDAEFVRRVRPGDIIVAAENFGCGSSREHAVWALMDFGFRAVIAPSFSDIFHNNCLKNGMLPVTLPAADVRSMIDALLAAPGGKVQVDLEGQTVTGPNGEIHAFGVASFAKTCLLEGMDEIALTLTSAAEIDRYERERKKATPWLFLDLAG